MRRKALCARIFSVSFYEIFYFYDLRVRRHCQRTVLRRAVCRAHKPVRSGQGRVHREGQNFYRRRRYFILPCVCGGLYIHVGNVRFRRAQAVHAVRLSYGRGIIFKKFSRNCCVFRTKSI